MLTHIKRILSQSKRAVKKEASKTLAGALRLGMISVIMSVVGLVMISVIIPKPKKITKGTTLYIEIDRPLTTASPYDSTPQWQFFIGSQTVSATSIVGAIGQAALDRRIERLILDLDGMEGSSLGAAQIIKDAVEAFRGAGKPASVYATSYDGAQYLIASASDEILAHPEGRFTAGTMKAGGLYLGEAFERYGVEVITGKAGRYKSAIEPYTRRSMSGEAREATEVFLRARLDAYKTETRPAGFDKLTFPAGLSEAEAASLAGLIDETIKTPDLMNFAFGNSTLTAFPYTTLGAYWGDKKKPAACKAAYDQWERDEDPRFGEGDKGDKIGLVFLEGAIVRGEGEQGIIGDVATTQKIELMRRDPSIKALVLRVDSPGGDAVASEVVRSGIEAFKTSGRPVFVSMGSVAASGGYWIASAGDRILAEPTTLTGSIGVFSIRTSGAGALESLGIRYDGIQIGADRSFGTIVQPIAEGEQQRLQSEVERIYGDFRDLVVSSRGLDEDRSQEWAEGRVWSATDAMTLGLVDELGSLHDAVNLASEATGIPTPCTKRARSRTRAGNLIAEVLATFVPGPAIPFPDEFAIVSRALGANGAVWAYCLHCSAH